MMFRSIVLLALPLLAVATPRLTARGGGSGGTCNTGSIQCCNDVYKSNSEKGKALLKEHNLEAHPNAAWGSVAANCNTGIGILDSPTCSATPVCCESGAGSLVSIGCIPIIVN
ncbi:hypothetical protein BC629DRAFT_1598615 [Irpex lacteus]|nr:hypothetical protein BC629DRAFT_1598615 [Irpex lacteus]